MPPFETMMIIGAVFLLAGGVKGVVGLGLPTVSLGLLTLAFGLTEAMALMLAPSFITNVWQAVVGGSFTALLKRLWPFLMAATIAIFVGAEALSRVDLHWLSALLGVLIVLYAALGLMGWRPKFPPTTERTVGPVLGIINGALTGMTGSFVVPGVMFLQAIGLSRDQLVQAMGILFTLSTAALALALGGSGFLNTETSALSAAAVVPAVIGMIAGQNLRGRLSEAAFRKALFIALLVLGIYIETSSFV